MKKKIIISLLGAVFLMTLSAEALCTQNMRNEAERYDRIRYLQDVVDSIKKDIEYKESLIAKERSPQKVHLLSLEIAELRDKLDDAEKDFVDYAADSNIFESQQGPEPQQKDLSTDFQEVITPVISSIKRASERPRRIEKLRAQIAELDLKIKHAEKGLASIDDLISSTGDQPLRQKLADAKARVEEFRSNSDFRLGVLKDQLEEELKDNKPFLQTAGEMLKAFFSEKGVNLLIAVLTILAVLLVMFGFERMILKPYLYSSRAHFISKPVESLFSLSAVVISLLCGLISLYILNDWFLFTLMLLILMGIGWSLKHLLVRFMDAVKLMLGFGTVKIGQRITYEGCQWRVKRIRMNTVLENELLEGGIINVDITKIMGLSSRRMHADEPMFPTKRGDWVVLSDGVYGKVTVQTPEQVVVDINGITPCFYKTHDFVSLRPQNLSRGFVLEMSIGLDYKHQKEISDVIESFKKRFPKDKVYFGKAGAHGLDLNFEFIFDGKSAERYKELFGELQRSLVEVCTKNKYEIAFEQLQVRVKNK